MKLRWLRDSWLRVYLSNYPWFRKLAGGKWERWYVDRPVIAFIWHEVDMFTREKVEASKGEPPPDNLLHPYWRDFRPTPLCRGICDEENWI